jgi:IclR family KDG regulon transcriptional repressor
MARPVREIMAKANDKSYYFLNTVSRAVKVLEQFIGTEGELSVAEIARRTGLHKSVAHRQLATLSDLGMLAPGSVDGMYRLGVKSLELGLSYIRHSPIDRVCSSHLTRLAQELPEFVLHVAILDSTEIVYQKSVSGPQVGWYPLTLGRRRPAYCTALGKVLLAYLSSSELESYLSKVELRPFTPKTITSSEALRKELEQIRLQGWAFDNQESTERYCMGAPIRDHTGMVVASLSLAGLDEHIQKYGQPYLVDKVREVAAAISYDLGFSPRRI